MSQIHDNIIFTPTYETDGQINFLDLLLRNTTSIEIDIFRKSTTTDTTIHYQSYHPTEQKMAAYRFFLRRMHALPLKMSRKHKEWNIIQQFAHANGISFELLQKLHLRIEHQINNPLQDEIFPQPKEKGNLYILQSYYPDD